MARTLWNGGSVDNSFLANSFVLGSPVNKCGNGAWATIVPGTFIYLPLTLPPLFSELTPMSTGENT